MFKRNEPIKGFLSRELPLLDTDAHADDAATSSATAALVRPDGSWRIAESDFFEEIGWMVGATIAFTPTSSGVRLSLAGSHATGASSRIDKRHRLMLPRATREALRVSVAQPLLLLGDPSTGVASLTTIHAINQALKEAS